MQSLQTSMTAVVVRDRRVWPLIFGLLLGVLAAQITQFAFMTRQAPTDVAQFLHKRVRILCLIMTHAANYATKAVAVNNTWARRCNRYAFVGSNVTKLDIPLIRLSVADGYGSLWQKVWMSLDHVERYFNLSNFDFVLKADDDTYVVMENLRLLLLPLDPKQPSYLGRMFKLDGDPKRPYMSGGAGYVLSRAAVRLFARRAVRRKEIPDCNLDLHFAEDVHLGACLQKLGVRIADSRDTQGLETFHPLNPEYMIGQDDLKMPDWMWKYNYHPFRACQKGCVSSVSTTFHYITPNNMYMLDFLLYGMRPAGSDPTALEVRQKSCFNAA